MTATRRWLQARKRELARRTVWAGLLRTLGVTLIGVGTGVVLGRLGWYQRLPGSVLVAWVAIIGAIAWGLVWTGRRLREVSVPALAEAVERAGARRRGWVAGVSQMSPETGSAALASLADAQVASWLARAGHGSLAAVQRRADRALRRGVSWLLVGGVVFVGVGPADGSGDAFWRPFAPRTRDGAAVTLSVDREQVPRGGSVTARVMATRRAAAVLWQRRPGESWQPRMVQLDSVGVASVTIGPLESDLFLRAESGQRMSDTKRVRVSLPALLTELSLVARYPAHLDLPDEPLEVDQDSLPLPVGTVVATTGRATVPLERAAWVGARGEAELAAAGTTFRGTLDVRRTARWRLVVTPSGGGALDEALPEIVIVAVPDAAPTVTIPVPGRDTVAPLSLRKALVVDARDDHALRRLLVVSWRASRLGIASRADTAEVPLPAGGTDRAVAHWTLDLNGRGFLPGDTAYFFARAYDNAPRPQSADSRRYRLRLPLMAELRRGLRETSRSARQQAESLVAAQSELARQLRDLAAARERAPPRDASAGGLQQGPSQLPFEAVERARALLQEEAGAVERARNLRDGLRQLAEAAWSAGLTDPAFRRQLREVRDLIDRALSAELVARLQSLEHALQRLDRDAVRDALSELARSADELFEEFARGRELFERAALEGDMTTLADDAAEVAARQREWNAEAVTQESRVAAMQEETLAARADTLSEALERLRVALDSMGQRSELAGDAQGARAAAEAMRRAAQQTLAGERGEARQSGQTASRALDPLSRSIAEQRDAIREAWRREVLATLDRALVETADMARQQQALASRLQRGESGADVRGAQAAAREGVDRLVEQLKSAAGRNALVSPQLGAALGLARGGMDGALEQLQRPAPSARAAGDLAAGAVDALNRAVYALVRSRGDVAAAASGSGLQEAVERLAQLAERQGQLSGESGELMSMMAAGGAQVLEELGRLAEQQWGLADALEQLDAGGQVSGADALAEEARDVARALEQGRLDREIVERQERLYRRLLDAGRSLESDDEDPRRDRTSEAADPTNVRVPGETRMPDAAPRYPYPTWDELRALTPAERRLILEYFRRLNRERP